MQQPQSCGSGCLGILLPQPRLRLVGVFEHARIRPFSQDSADLHAGERAADHKRHPPAALFRGVKQLLEHADHLLRLQRAAAHVDQRDMRVRLTGQAQIGVVPGSYEAREGFGIEEAREKRTKRAGSTSIKKLALISSAYHCKVTSRFRPPASPRSRNRRICAPSGGRAETPASRSRRHRRCARGTSPYKPMRRLATPLMISLSLPQRVLQTSPALPIT